MSKRSEDPAIMQSCSGKEWRVKGFNGDNAAHCLASRKSTALKEVQITKYSSIKIDSVAHLGVPHCRNRLIVFDFGGVLTKFQITLKSTPLTIWIYQMACLNLNRIRLLFRSVTV